MRQHAEIDLLFRIPTNTITTLHIALLYLTMKMKTKFSENEAGITLLFNRASEAQTHNVYAVFKKTIPSAAGPVPTITWSATVRF